MTRLPERKVRDLTCKIIFVNNYPAGTVAELTVRHWC